MNDCIAMETFPTPLNFADVSPIFKSDDNMNKGNFRHVSIFSISTPLYEGILNDQMLDHVRKIFDVLLSADVLLYATLQLSDNTLKILMKM